MMFISINSFLYYFLQAVSLISHLNSKQLAQQQGERNHLAVAYINIPYFLYIYINLNLPKAKNGDSA